MASGSATDGRGAGGPAAAGGPVAPAVVAVRGAVLALAVFATSALGFAVPHFGGRLHLLLLPSGIAVAALVRWGRGLWPAVLLAELGFELWAGTRLVPALVIAAGLPAGAFATAWLLERHRFDRGFSHARDVPVFLAATLLGMAVTSIIGNLGFLIGPAAPGAEALDYLRWWSNTAAGVLLLGPPLLALDAAALERLRAAPVRALLYGATVLALTAALLLVKPQPDLAPGVRSPFLVVSLVLIVVGVVRFGLVTGATTTLLLSAGAALAFAFDRGLMTGLPEIEGLVLLWSYTGATTAFGLIVTALLAERDAAAAERL
ncbi:MAG: MASE1 domain-containing protein, partial [Proteobacteria bacterium]|nr:MASE1 domain-containing protein [Pseudomonadota bacterium]